MCIHPKAQTTTNRSVKKKARVAKLCTHNNNVLHDAHQVSNYTSKYELTLMFLYQKTLGLVIMIAHTQQTYQIQTIVLLSFRKNDHLANYSVTYTYVHVPMKIMSNNR